MRRPLLLVALLLSALPAAADVITSATLQISGADFKIVNPNPVVQLGSPAIVQTSIGGLQNDQAPVFTDGTFATGELIGPGITTPVPFVTAPGRAFTVSGLSQEGTYYLQNVRMMNGTRLLQVASPALAVIQVTNALDAKVTVTQLSADDLRKRGISLNPDNYDVYEYTFSFLVNGATVEIPYPVVVNRITHEVTPLPQESPYNLPTDRLSAPPRWNPPATVPFEFPEPVAFKKPPEVPDNPDAPPPPRPSIHAAIVIPNSLAVLHEFFGLALVVTNGAPVGSAVTLDSITAAIDMPNQLRVTKVDPPVTFGQPVTIAGPNGITVLAAQVQGKAEWTLESLKAGTYTVNLDVKATFHSPGQPDLPLEATPSASIVVHDARFNITFSHPDTIRKGLQYSTHTFITNVSEAAQDIKLSDGELPACGSGVTRANICRIDSTPSSYDLHLEPGETKSVEYKLQSSLTGHVFATAVSIDGTDSAINSAAFTLDMGVSPTGVPLSPVTLILPHYATTPYLSQSFLDDQLGFLGIAYSLATAPMNKTTAKFPHLIKSDVFTRAVDIARAGERIFIGEDRRDSLANLALDLLGNDVPLAEYDQFRRQEVADPAGDTARAAMSALASELAGAYGTDGTFNGMADRFASATTDRAPYLLALAHGAKNGTAPSLTIQATSGGLVLDDAKRDIAYGEVQPIAAASESGTLALIGRASGTVDLTVTATITGQATLDLIVPSADGKTLVRASAQYGATAGQAIHVHVAAGTVTATESNVVFNPVSVPLAPIRVVAARQDLYLDSDGHVVSVLYNRRLQPTTADLSPNFDTDVTLDASFGVSFSGKRKVAGAALQTDGRIIRLNYDAALSHDAQYAIHINNIPDPGNAATVVPTIETRSSALLYGSVLKGDNTPVPGAELTLTTETGVQYQTANAAGQFLFEYVPRDPDNSINGGYKLKAVGAGQQSTLEGSVRLLHTVHRVNIVFLGRGSAKGTVRYEDGTPVAGATVTIGSTMFSQFRSGSTKSAGDFSISDLPVGPLTFSAQDAAGNVAYAANELHGAGEIVLQDITIIRKPFPGTGTVRGRIVRSDTSAPVPNTHVGAYSQGYGLQDGFTDALGRFEFSKVPSGFVTILAENYTVAPRSVAVDFDLKADEVRDVPDLVLNVPAAASLVAVAGSVTIEDPYVAGRFSPVPLAQVQIDGMPVTTADTDGNYHYDAVPTSFAKATVRGFDPKSGRIGTATLPQTLSTTDPNNVPIVITNAGGSGTGTIRVHLLDARGQPVSGYHVFEPGFPRLESEPAGEGIYEFTDLRVGASLDVVAAPSGTRDPVYGYQWTEGHAGVSFPGQIAALTLHLPGQGSVNAIIQQQTEAGVIVQVAGQLHLRHRVWSDAEQNPISLTRLGTTDGTNDAMFTDVPAGESIALETFESVGYDSTSFVIPFDGAPVRKILTLSTLSSVHGHVFMPDGYTPVANAQVNLVDGAQDMGWLPTAIDGSFLFRNVEPASGFTVKAEFTQNGIFRTGYVTGSTPSKGGPVDGVAVILMTQGAVEGTVVDASNNPIPFAKIWARELSFPNHPFGSQADPLLTDANGHFRFSNVFTVPFRIDAEDPNNPDLKGSFNGIVPGEGQTLQATLVVGGAGTGDVQILVKDPNTLQPVANAEVSLFRGGLFDFGSTDINGTVTFQQVPVGTSYTASAYSKALGKFGATDSAFAVTKGNTAAVTINLVFSGEVKGTLDDPQNSLPGVPGADVTLNGAGYSTRATTDTTGAFDFNGVREGTVDLVARDPSSIRMARSKATVSPDNRTVTVPMHLEPTSTLVVKVFLPNDSGASSGVLAPTVEIDLVQFAPGGQYHRTSQTNGDSFPGLVRGIGFQVNVSEIGGLNRKYRVDDIFDASTASKEIDVVLAATGSVNVHVQQGSPAADAPNVQVTASSGGVTTSAFTDASGKVMLSRLPLGTVSIQATTISSQPLTGATSVSLTSQTQPASASILLGSYGGVTGKVIAEAGGPSAGTRVFAAFSGISLETRTDSTGAYGFMGIATPPTGGTTINLTYIGPDDNTVGAAQSVVLHSSDGILGVPDVTLDSTPPRLLSIFPADGATKVAPDTQLKFTFSRAVRDDQINNGYFKLFDVGAAQQLTLTLVSKDVLPDKSEIITFNPPATPPSQRFPLKSNTLYRTEVSPDLQDLANHKLNAAVGASFTTSDYSNPQVIKVDPKSPLPKNNFRLAVTFSKPLSAAAWTTGGSGVMTLTPISAIGGVVNGSPLPGQTQLDPNTNATLYFAPDVFLAEASYYRLTISGVTDLEGRGLVDAAGNPLATFTQDFSSYDTTAPGIAIGNAILNGTAIGDTDPLFLGAIYRFPVTLTNAADLDHVDFYSVDAAGVETKLSHSTATSTDLPMPAGITTFTLKAIVYDLSGNTNTARRSWTVSQQPALSVTSAAITPAVIYANNKLTDTVVISGGGLDETVTITAKIHGSSGTLGSTNVKLTRATFDSAWPQAVLQLTIPATVAGGSSIDVVEDISDVRGGVATHTSNFTLATDSVAPLMQPLTIQVISGTSNTAFHNNDTFRVHAFAKDGETGVKQVVFNVDGLPYQTISSNLLGSGYTEYVSETITVKARNNDLAMPVSAVATDYAALSTTTTTSVTYLGQHDPNAPTAAWIAPLHDAAWPAGAAFSAKLRLYATSSLPLTATFDVPGMTPAQPGTRNGNEFDLDVVFAQTPAAGTPFRITAHVSDGDGNHNIDLPIDIDLVAVTQTLHNGDTFAVDDAHPLTGDSILVDAGARLVPHIPLTLKNLIVVNGGLVDTVASTTTIDQKMTLTVSDHLYVDDASSIDVSHRGYLGGLQQNFDNADANPSRNGVTVGRTTTGGAANGASASYAGIGGTGETGPTNATYGSITAPFDLGSGGAADSGNRRGGQGGGALSVGGAGKIVIAGKIAADGESGQNIGGAGSGGSVHLAGARVVVGAYGTVTANGGDDDGSGTLSRGAGGGRIALEAAELLEIDANNGTRVFAHGGRNLTGESPSILEGGAGTIFFRAPGATDGDLVVSDEDPRNPSTSHAALSTVLAGTPLSFDHLTVGPRGLARADAPLTIGGAVDDRTKATINATGALVLAADQPTISVTTAPQAGASVIAGTGIALTYTATSKAGVASVTSTLAPVLAAVTDSYAFPLTTTTSPAKTLNIPQSTAAGNAALSVHVADRAGRSADAAPSTFAIIANTPPQITAFAVTAPSPLYIGATINTSVTAADDVALTKLTFTTQLGAQTPVVQTYTPPANTASTTQTYALTIPKDQTLDGTSVVLTANAQDAAGAPGTTSTRTLPIAHDGVKPAVTITEPNASTQAYDEGSSKLITVTATATDAETGVQSITASIEGGSTVTMTPTGTPNQYGAALPIPAVPGTVQVTRKVTVTVTDYAGNVSAPTANVAINPNIDPSAPVITLLCGSNGAMVPVGSTITLSANVVPGTNGNLVDTVTFDDGSGTNFTVNHTTGSSVYSINYPVPNRADGDTIKITVTATSGTGSQSEESILTAVIVDKTIPAGTTVQNGDATYDFQNVVVSSGTVTLIGHHEFKRLLVINGATVTQKTADVTSTYGVDIKTTLGTYVGCNSFISVNNTGYTGNTTYPGAAGTGGSTGGNHLGYGGGNSAPNSTYGSVYHPKEAGSGGNRNGNGGGIVRIDAGAALTVDGTIRADGCGSGGVGDGCAGGSIWITAPAFAGNGSIEAKGGAGLSGSGAGGAIALEYTTAAGSAFNTLSATGGSTSQPGGAGTIYLKQAAAPYGTLIVNNGGFNATTELPPLGFGKAAAGSSGATLITDRSANIPVYFDFNWVQVTSKTTGAKNLWRVASPTAKTLTLLPNGNETINVQEGDSWRGVYRFDTVTVTGNANLISNDPILIGNSALQTVFGSTVANVFSTYNAGITGDDIDVIGHVMTPSITGANLTFESGALVTDPNGSSLTITATGAVNIKPGASIDVSQRGYGGNTSYPGAAPLGGSTGGNHLGYGGGNSAANSTYGSVYHPNELGSGGNRNGGGGGAVKINAAALTNDGSILANGCGGGGVGDGCAGGSVWIIAPSVGGAGIVQAKGGAGLSGSGAGGAIAIEYTTAAGTMLNNLSATGGSTSIAGGAGTVYLKQAAAPYGTLTVDNNGFNAITELPPLGAGKAAAGSTAATLITDRSANIPAYFDFNWVQVTSKTTGAKNLWRVANPNAKTLTLLPNGNETINVQEGDSWRGVYRFDTVTVTGNANLISNDPILIGANAQQTIFGSTVANVFSTYNAGITGDDIDVIGHVMTPSITGANLTFESGALITDPNGSSLTITATGAVNIKPGASIDVSQRGYGGNTTYPGAAPLSGNGGNHLGFGGGNTASNSTYGSVYRPSELGSGGQRNGGGGGAVKITAAALTDDGSILANGCGGGGVGDGCAGGSVWIIAPSVGGAGIVEARGGNGLTASGAGGAIALEYTTSGGMLLSNLRAFGGSTSTIGGPGTIYLKPSGGTYGTLTINNNGLGGTTELPSLGYGLAVNGSTGNALITDRTTNIQGYFGGNWVEVRNANNGLKGAWRFELDPLNPKKVTLVPNGTESIDIQSGDQWRGIYKFDSLTINGAVTLRTGDRIDAPISGGTIVGNDQGPPVINPANISIGVGTLSPVMTGTAGAVTDLDQPITVIAQNATSGQSFTTTAAADGSFAVPLHGSTGDSISVLAKDGNVFPMQSLPVFIGTLPSSNTTPVAFPFNATMTANDSSFRARRLSFDGTTLVAQNYPASTDSNKLLVFDLSNGSPAWTQTISVPNNTHDVVVRNNVAYVAAACCSGILHAYDLSVNPATRVTPSSSPCNHGWSVAIDGDYVYVGGDCGDGRVVIYDITNPKSPVKVRDQGFSGLSNFTFTQLIPYGNYLIGISPNGGTNGPDVAMIDRRDINNLVLLWTKAITGFTAFRGAVAGQTLYVSGNEGSMAVMDLTDPTVAVVKSVFAAGTAAHGVAAVGTLGFLAADTAGVAAVNAADTANPVPAGSVVTSPQAAWDVVIRGQLGIIAAEDRLLTFAAGVPPQVNPSKISMSFDGHSLTLTAAAAAVLGAAPLTAEVRDDTTGAKASGVTVAADGSFNATLAASSGDAISVVATDTNGAKSAAVSVGAVPFGPSTTLVSITAAMAGGDGNFRAKHLSIDGNTLAVVNYPIGGTDTNKLLIFDLSSGTPVLAQTIAVPNNTHDVVVKNNVAYVAAACCSGMFHAYDLSVNPATRVTPSSPCNHAYSVAVDGAYAYSGGDCGDGHIAIYDITNPKSPIKVRDQGISGLSNFTFTQLIPYGNYLIGISPNGGASGTDVVIIDRRDINNLTRVSSTAVLGLVSFRGAVQGQTLYLSGEGTNTAMAVMDLSNVNAPAYTVYPTVGGSRGVAVTGNLAAFGDGTPGVTFFDVTNPASPRLIGTQYVGGMSWDVQFAGGKLYAAIEEGIAVINGVIAPPVIDASRITVARTSAMSATVTGSANAITGAAAPLTAEVRDDTTGAKASGVTVAADGSFNATLAASSGDAISVVATDVNGAKSAVVSVGAVPFGSSATLVPITAAMAGGDGNFRAKHLSIDGNTLAVVNYPIGGTDTNKLLIFDLSSGTPVLTQTIAVPNNTHDVVVKNNVAYVAAACCSGMFHAYDLSVNPATRVTPSSPCNHAYSVAVDGAYAYSGGDCGDGHIAIYDITNPKSPIKVRDQGLSGLSNFTFTQLLPYGNYLIGISPNGGTNGTDVVIIDRRDVNNLIKVSSTAVLGLVSFRGAVQGQTLYLSGEGTNTAMAVMDLSNVNAPTYAVYPTVGGSRGVAVTGNLAAFGDGTPGVTFFDVTNPASPRLIGTQYVGGMSWDLQFAGGKLYAAVEQGIAVINGVIAPPVIDASRITVARASATSATVTGSALAVAGASTPMTLQIKNGTTSVTTSGVAVAADGSFTATIAATSGDNITLFATDAAGRASATLTAGIVPFGTLLQVPTQTLPNDNSFRAKHLSVDGNTLAVVNYPIGGTDTNKLLIFDLSSGTPVLAQTIAVPNNTHDVVVKNNVAYVAAACCSGMFHAYDLSVNPATRVTPSSPCNHAYSVAVDGAYAYSGGDCGDGHIAIYDITNPKSPIKVRDQGLSGLSSITFTQLIPYGNYLIGITPNGGTSGTDVVIIDRRDVNNLIKVSSTAVIGLVSFRGTVQGQTLYLSGEGTNTAMAVMDLSNVNAPTYTVYPTVGGSRGVAVTGNLAAFGDGTPGVTFFDVTNPASPRLIGTQYVGGMSWDVAAVGAKLYVASEQMVNIIDTSAFSGSSAPAPPVAQAAIPSPSLPPQTLRANRSLIDTSLRDGRIAVHGARGALIGPRPISIEIRNLTMGTSLPVVPVAADGSFDAEIDAAPEDHILIVATSGDGERLEIDLETHE